MRHVNILIVMTAIVFVAAGSARGSTSSGPLLLDSAAVTSSGLSSLPVMKGNESLSNANLPAAQESTVAQLFVAATAEDGEKNPNPPPRSTHCPPDKDDHKGGDNQAKDSKDKDNKDKDNKDKDQHDNCGKGDDGKNP
jgi:hypothetical protein